LSQVALLKRHLYGEGIHLEMLRSPQSLSATGCSFALRCRQEDLLPLQEACARWKITPGGCFLESASGEGKAYSILNITGSGT